MVEAIFEYFEHHFHRGEMPDCIGRALRVIAAEKWRIYEQILAMQTAPDGQRYLERFNKLKLLIHFFRGPIRIYDLEYQLEHESDQTRRANLLEEYAKLVDGLGTTAYVRAKAALNSGNLDDAMTQIRKAIETTPDTPQYRLEKAKILRTMASLEEHGALDESPEHPQVQGAVRLSTEIDELRDQLQCQGLSVKEFLELAEIKLKNAIEAGQLNPRQWDQEVVAKLGSLDGLTDESIQFLRTGEYLRSKTTPWQDYSPLAVEFSKAVERELLVHVFRPFRDSVSVPVTLRGSEKPTPLEKFIAGGRDLTLGEMGFLICRIGGRGGGKNTGAYEQELRTHTNASFGRALSSVRALLDPQQVSKHRNQAAHPEPMSRSAAESARDWAYDILVLLLGPRPQP